MATKSQTSPHAFNPDAKPFQPETHALNAAAAPFVPNPDSPAFVPSFLRVPELRPAKAPSAFTEASVPILSGFRLHRNDAAATTTPAEAPATSAVPQPEIDVAERPVEPTAPPTAPSSSALTAAGAGPSAVSPGVASRTTRPEPAPGKLGRGGSPSLPGASMRAADVVRGAGAGGGGMRAARPGWRPPSQLTLDASVQSAAREAALGIATPHHIDPGPTGPSRLLAVPRSGQDGALAARRRAEMQGGGNSSSNNNGGTHYAGVPPTHNGTTPHNTMLPPPPPPPGAGAAGATSRLTPPSPMPPPMAHYKPMTAPALGKNGDTVATQGNEAPAMPTPVLQWQPPQRRMLERQPATSAPRAPMVQPVMGQGNAVVTPMSETPSSTNTSRDNVDSTIADRLNSATPYVPKGWQPAVTPQTRPATGQQPNTAPATAHRIMPTSAFPRPPSATPPIVAASTNMLTTTTAAAGAAAAAAATATAAAAAQPASGEELIMFRPYPVIPLAAAAHLKTWQPPQPLKVVSRLAQRRHSQIAPMATFTPDNPLVVLIFGCRGAGKTTQSALLAARYNLLHLSSGDMVAQHKNPYEELRRRVREHFGPAAAAEARRYNGLVLDRFLAISEADGYYLQWALAAAGLPVPLAFWLCVDPRLALERANARNDGKMALERWRLEEQRIQALIADTVYRPANCLVTIDCETNGTDAVFDCIVREVETRGVADGPTRRLPAMTLVPGNPALRLIDNFEVFTALTVDVHASIDNVNRRRDTAPLSLVGEYISRQSFVGEESKHVYLPSMNVTLKVDGKRFLVMKHRKYGYVGFPAAFTSCYDLNTLFDGLHFAAPPPPTTGLRPSMMSDATAQCPVEFLLDAELVLEPGEDGSGGDDKNGLSRATLHVIDYVYFYGTLARRVLFETRYKTLRAWFENMLGELDAEARQRCPIVLKKYVPINRLGELLADFGQSPLKIDGVIFQHNKTYHYGVDRELYKWKPKELCTADFRLMNGRVSGDGRSWQFQLYVSDTLAKTVQPEREFPGALGVFSTEEVEAQGLRDNVVVELSLVETDRSCKPASTRWSFQRRRDDKPSPNKYSVVSRIVDMQHLTYPELVKLCGKVRYNGSL